MTAYNDIPAHNKWVHPESKELWKAATLAAMAAKKHCTGEGSGERGGLIHFHFDHLLRHGDPDAAPRIIQAIADKAWGTKDHSSMVDFFKYVKDGDTVDDIARRHIEYMDHLNDVIDHIADHLADGAGEQHRRSFVVDHVVREIAREFAIHADLGIPGLREAKEKIFAERGSSQNR